MASHRLHSDIHDRTISLAFNTSVTVWNFITSHQVNGNPSLLPSRQADDLHPVSCMWKWCMFLPAVDCYVINLWGLRPVICYLPNVFKILVHSQ